MEHKYLATMSDYQIETHHRIERVEYTEYECPYCGYFWGSENAARSCAIRHNNKFVRDVKEGDEIFALDEHRNNFVWGKVVEVRPAPSERQPNWKTFLYETDQGIRNIAVCNRVADMR